MGGRGNARGTEAQTQEPKPLRSCLLPPVQGLSPLQATGASTATNRAAANQSVPSSRSSTKLKCKVFITQLGLKPAGLQNRQQLRLGAGPLPPRAAGRRPPGRRRGPGPGAPARRGAPHALIPTAPAGPR